MTLWLISPAFGRLAVSEIVYEQRRWMLAELAAMGVAARALVISDDENLELARASSLDALEHPNSPLGRKVNAGFEHALKEGASHVAFVGSDSIYLPKVFASLIDAVTTYGRWYGLAIKGRGIVVCDVPHPTWALNVYPRDLLLRARSRPVADGIDKGLDGSIRNNLIKIARRPYAEQLVDVSPLQTITIRTEQQITSTDRLASTYGVSTEQLSAMRKAGYRQSTVAAIRRLFSG